MFVDELLHLLSFISGEWVYLCFVGFEILLYVYCVERCKREFSCYKQKVRGSGSSSQLRAKGSEGRMTERSDKDD